MGGSSRAGLSSTARRVCVCTHVSNGAHEQICTPEPRPVPWSQPGPDGDPGVPLPGALHKPHEGTLAFSPSFPGPCDSQCLEKSGRDKGNHPQLCCQGFKTTRVGGSWKENILTETSCVPTVSGQRRLVQPRPAPGCGSCLEPRPLLPTPPSPPQPLPFLPHVEQQRPLWHTDPSPRAGPSSF